MFVRQIPVGHKLLFVPGWQVPVGLGPHVQLMHFMPSRQVKLEWQQLVQLVFVKTDGQHALSARHRLAQLSGDAQPSEARELGDDRRSVPGTDSRSLQRPNEAA